MTAARQWWTRPEADLLGSAPLGRHATGTGPLAEWQTPRI